MKICIVSDSHDRGPMLAEAVAFAKTEGAEAVMRFEIRRLTDRPAGATFDTSITA